MSPHLVKIASDLSLPEAEAMRICLNTNGITARLDDVAMTLWMWNYSDAIGGVKLSVRDIDVVESIELLHRNGRVKQPPWKCSHCQVQVAGEWDICWRCGTNSNGLRNDEFFRDPQPTNALERSNGSVIVGFATIASVFSFIATGGSALPILAWLVILGFSTILFRRRNRSDVNDLKDANLPPFCVRCKKPLDEKDVNCGHCGDVVVDVIRRDPKDNDRWQATEIGGDRRLKIGDSIALRAWHAAMIGMVGFPPLNLYSIWLLLKINSAELPISKKHWTRYSLTWLINISVLLMLVMFVIIVFAGQAYFSIDMAGDFFDLTREPQR